MTATRMSSDEQEALNVALAAEHAAIYGYGVVGAQLSGRRRKAAREVQNAHRTMRDRLSAMLQAAGASPTPAAPGYALPGRVDDAEAAVRLAVRLEERTAQAYTELVGASDGDHRELAGGQLRDCALRAARWRGSTVAFPGLPR